MSQWAFVIFAFTVTLAGTAVLTGWAWASMRSAEKRADSLSERR